MTVYFKMRAIDTVCTSGDPYATWVVPNTPDLTGANFFTGGGVMPCGTDPLTELTDFAIAATWLAIFDDAGNIVGANGILGVAIATYNSEQDDGDSGATKTIDFATGALRKLTLTDATPVITFVFVGVGFYQLKLLQDGTGNRVPTYVVSGGVVYVVSGFALSTAASAQDIVTLYYDGTDAWIVVAPTFA